MKKIFLKVLLLLIIILTMITFAKTTYATESIDNISSDEIKEYLESTDTNNIDASEIINIYDQLTEEYSNKEISNMIQENKEEIINKTGIDEDTLDKGTSALSSLNTEETKKILKEDLNIEEIKQKLDEGYTVSQIVNDIQEKMPTSKKISIAIKILLASSIIKTILIIWLALVVYKIIRRWIIFKKAEEYGWAAIIPIYNEITYLNVCNISPWWILVLFIPIFGLLIYLIVKIISKFTLAESFNKGKGFGFGLLLFGIIFESILAFNKNIKYVEYKE